MLEFAIAILFLGVASYYDLFKKRVIPDWLSYSFVAVCLLYMFFMEGIIAVKIGAAAGIFALGYLIYRLGYIGGADVLFISGLMLLLPLQIGATPSIIIVLLLSALLMAVYLEASYLSKNRNLNPKMQDMITAFVWIVGYGIIAYIMHSIYLDWLALLAIVVGVISAIFALIKNDLTKSMITWVKPNQIIEEDILAVEEMDKKIIEKLKLERLLTAKQISKIKKAKISKVPVYGKLPPYMPFILISVIGALAMSIML